LLGGLQLANIGNRKGVLCYTEHIIYCDQIIAKPNNCIKRHAIWCVGGRINEAAMGGARCAQRLALHVTEPIKTGVRSARAHTLGKTPLLYNNLRI
jgi:hypothetical protein